MNRSGNDALDARLPIKIDTTTNGEFAPKPLPQASVTANQVALSRVDAGGFSGTLATESCVVPTRSGTARLRIRFRRFDCSKFLTKAAGDSISRLRAAYANARDPSFVTYGPRTRAEFLRLRRLAHGQP
jgi:hypothetical protein